MERRYRERDDQLPQDAQLRELPIDDWRRGRYRESEYGEGRFGGHRAREGQGQGYGGQTGTQDYFRGSPQLGAPGYGAAGSTGEYGYGAAVAATSPRAFRTEGGYGAAGYGDSNFGHGGYTGMNPGGARPTQRSPKSYRRSDSRIHEDICERLTQRGDLDAGEVSIEVRDGRVSLEGYVPERRMRYAIEDLVDGVHGVQDVENRIRVRSLARDSHDRDRRPSSEGSTAAPAPQSGAQSLSSTAAGGASQEPPA